MKKHLLIGGSVNLSAKCNVRTNAQEEIKYEKVYWSLVLLTLTRKVSVKNDMMPTINTPHPDLIKSAVKLLKSNMECSLQKQC